MKNRCSRYLLYLLPILFLAACSGEKKDVPSEAGVSTVLPDAKSEVHTIILKKQDFNHELVSNGKISAKGFANLRFQSAEAISRIWVKNGDQVKKDQKLAELDKFRLTNKLEQAKDAMEKAKLELQDVLIGQGYAPDSYDKVPAEVMQLAKVRSGYDQNKAQYELTKYEEENATLKAPFDGTVANLFAKPFNSANTSEVFCTVVDTRNLEVEFTVLESELALIKTDDKVIITPYANPTSTHSGNISEINPLVDEKGMVRVKARMNETGKLFSGMNVRVSVHRSLGKQLVIPKSALVLRSNKQVVFTLKDGKAYWNYIHTALENATEYTVVEGLKEGDKVIISGNINLAHEATVKEIYD